MPNRMANTQFKPGQVANPNGRPERVKYISEALYHKLNTGDPTQAVLIADAIIDKAKTGEPAMVKELLDRVEGKVPAPIDINSKSINIELAASYSELLLAAREMMGLQSGMSEGEVKELPAGCPQDDG